MTNMFLSPPVLFVMFLIWMILISRLLSILSFRRKNAPESDIGKSYACGEDVPTHLIQPEYGDFFPFAFFFTILHVVALITTTVPVADIGNFSIATIYIVGSIAGLVIIFRR